MLDDLNGLVDFLRSNTNVFLTRGYAEEMLKQNIGDMHCVTCGDVRKMDVNRIYSSSSGGKPVDLKAEHLVHSIFSYRCLQCSDTYTAFIYESPSGVSLAIFSQNYGGVTTPHTPKGVAFYLDQAHRSASVAAYSAAIAMYRSALEWLLYEQGYEKGMLAEKIANFLNDIDNKNAPEWAYDIEPNFFEIVKSLGNASIHPNNGDISRQEILNTELLPKVKAVFSLLLYLIYEKNKKEDELLNTLRETVSKVKAK